MSDVNERSDEDAARALLRSLEQSGRADEVLDMRLAEYVDAALAGDDADALFPDVAEYLATSPHAQRLYAELLAIGDHDLDMQTPVDFAFLGERDPARTARWRERVVRLAERISSVLDADAGRISDYVESFFAIRPDAPERVSLQRGLASAFGADAGDVPGELRALEAAYTFLVLGDKGAGIDEAARGAAENAGASRRARPALIALLVQSGPA